MRHLTLKVIILFAVLLLFSCTIYKRLVRISPDFKSIRNNIDTITIISDALVAIDAKNDYYSGVISYVFDSLIIDGAIKALQEKGYNVKSLQPTLMGAFMDTVLNVPIKPFKSNELHLTTLPYSFPNQLSENQISSLKNISRRLYTNLVFSDQNQPMILSVSSQTKTDLDTISNLINGNYALFVFHQASLVNPVISDLLGLTAYVAVGIPIGRALINSKVSHFHTYTILVDLSTGKIIWSNYRNIGFAPLEPIFDMLKDNNSEFTNYIKSDSISQEISNKWSNGYLYYFPERNSSRFFDGFSRKRKYPAQNLFYPSQYSLYNELDVKYKKTIDSLVNNLSLSEKSVKWEYSNDNQVKRLNFYLDDIDSELDSLDYYFKYANHCRSRFKPLIEGKLKLSFSIAENGESRNVKVVESTLNDEVLEYTIPYILKLYKFSYGNYKPEKIYTHEISFTKPKWYLF